MSARDAGRDVAIIGMACRTPGAGDVAAYWRNLVGGVESRVALTDADLRAAGVDPKLARDPRYVRSARPIDGFDQFDAGLFELSPREARLMDPQQRVLLQVAWEALEDAGYRTDDYDGSIGVFVGAGGIVSSQFAAYPSLRGQTGGLEHICNDKDFLATRLSYKLNLRGPSLTVQTACSTSLVAAHLACTSILNGECDIALAGASVIRVPHLAGYLAPVGDLHARDGRCRAFDADASGTTFGSGVGVVVLKHLADALADGDQIYAVICGSAVNNDGAAKVSYTASSVPGQARAVLEALRRAGVGAETLRYVEAHGASTAFGDPLEVEALTHAFRMHSDRRGFCALASVKTNIGHLEQAAGVAALIKAALALKHRQIPPSLNFNQPNPRIDFAASPFFVPTTTLAWEAAAAHPRRAGVNSLGLGGTNAFLVLEEAPAPAPAADAAAGPQVLTLSAQGEAPLRELAERWRARLEDARTTPADLCFTANTGRATLSHRLAVTGADAGQLREALAPAKLKISAPAGRGGLAFLFPGQGAQYAGMGAELFDTAPTFRADLEHCDAVARPLLGRSLLEIMFASGPDAELLDRTDFTQPTLFSLEWALARLWMSWGVRPDVLVGHSLGEYVAACVAGVWDVETALPLVVRRAQLMQSLPVGGVMAALFADGAQVDALLDDADPGQIAVAAYNGALNTVVSGAGPAVEALLARAETAGIGARRLAVSHAFHSPLMEPILDAYEAAVAACPAKPPAIPVVGNLTGALWRTAPSPGYWRDHVRRAVQMRAGVRELTAVGVSDFLEVGPGSVLVSLARQALRGGEPGERRFMTSLAGESEWGAMTAALAGLWSRGAAVDWSAFHAPDRRRRVAAPTYPFRRERHWIATAPVSARAGDDGIPGRRVDSPLPAAQFEAELCLDVQPWLDDHRIFGLPVTPAAAILVGAVEAARRRDGRPRALRALTYQRAITLPEAGVVVVQTVLSGNDVEVVSREAAGSGWTTHVTARLGETEPLQRQAAVPEVAGLTAVAPADFYDWAGRLGLNYGPSFRNIAELWIGDGRAVTRVKLPSALAGATHPMHPALLDACLHVFPALAPDYDLLSGETPQEEGGRTYLPVSVERFEIFADGVDDVWVSARRRPSPDDGPRVLVVDLEIADAAGSPVASLEGLALRPIDRARLAGDGLASATHAIAWVERPAPTRPPPRPPSRWIVIARDAALADLLARDLEARGEPASVLAPPTARGDGVFLARLAEAVTTAPGRVGVLLALGDAEAAPDARTVQQVTEGEAARCGVAHEILQSLAAIDERDLQIAVWLITRRAAAVAETDAASDPLESELWSFGRTASIEFSRLWGAQIDLGEPGDADALAAALQVSDEDQIALRGGRLFAPRLTAVAPSAEAAARTDWGGCLITGGLGAVGLRLAAWLAANGARDLILAARRVPDAEALAEIERIQAAGARVTFVRADVGVDADVEALFQAIAAAGLELRSVFHCAGGLDDAILSQMDWRRFTAVTAPKTRGAWLLHKHAAGLPIERFVLFSSVLSVTGAMGQANYAAGNGFLDGLAAMRRRLGLPAQVVNWGPWAEAGLAVGAGDRGQAIWRSRGAAYLPPDAALDLLGRLMADGRSQTIVCLADWAAWAAQYPKPASLLQGWARQAGVGERAAPTREAVQAKLSAAPPAGRPSVVAAIAEAMLRGLLEADEALDPARPMKELGLDSLMAITLANQIDDAFGVRLPMNLLLQGGALTELVGEICERAGLAEPALLVAAL
ncbi:MAG TPA: type I polyketide synthase [Caulobacteraceae bacterium]